MKILYCNHALITEHMAEALVMGGLPMSTTTDNLGLDIKALCGYLHGYDMEFILRHHSTEDNAEELSKRLLGHIKRGTHLGNAHAGSGHDCVLKGIVVTAIVSMPAYQWTQVQRYHFLDITSSQSKMHRITKMDLEKQCNEEVDPWILERLNTYVSQYNILQEEIEKIKGWKADTPANAAERHHAIEAAKAEAHKVFRKLVNNAPQGLNLAAGIVTNYLQLKTMKLQRKDHKLEEWSKDFVAWVDSLPRFNEITGV